MLSKLVLLFIISIALTSSPFSLLLLLLLLASLSSFFLSLSCCSVWYSLFLFFILIGGVLILISYCSSFLPSEPGSMPLSYLLFFTTISLLYSVVPQSSLHIFMLSSSLYSSPTSITILYTSSWVSMIIMLFGWLLLVLAYALKMMKLGCGHLREVFSAQTLGPPW